jgi:hypothetical protein
MKMIHMKGGQSGNRVEERKRGWRTGESDKGREIVCRLEESIKECKTGEKGQKRDREKEGEKKEEGEGRNGKNDMRKKEKDRKKVEKKNIPNVHLSCKHF